MKTLFNRTLFTRELQRLARESKIEKKIQTQRHKGAEIYE